MKKARKLKRYKVVGQGDVSLLLLLVVLSLPQRALHCQLMQCLPAIASGTRCRVLVITLGARRVAFELGSLMYL